MQKSRCISLSFRAVVIGHQVMNPLTLLIASFKETLDALGHYFLKFRIPSQAKVPSRSPIIRAILTSKPLCISLKSVLIPSANCLTSKPLGSLLSELSTKMHAILDCNSINF
eukprot:TRINITY_DN17876_c0_g1_i4.p1 TRINITY_DN17876_c0_g1~~TRINITY_DN17876_c0_g1_i4.p1  ORF type:complete len:112 (+),score=11.85 TRINITY_DN17876_c0_g1_i4:368-703(+)